MAELLIRAGANDAEMIGRVLRGPVALRPARIVVDAHVAASAPTIAAAASIAGVPFLIDPQTHHLQGAQHHADPWARLSFACSQPVTPQELLAPGRAIAVANEVIDYQLAYRGTALVAPYVHIERQSTGWVEVQIALWQATRQALDDRGLRPHIVAMLALGWRLLERPTWPGTLSPLRRELAMLAPTEVAMAASKVDQGVHPDQRLSALIVVIRRLSREHPVIAWQQGALGEAAVAGGALGYETGIGWRERCDLQTAMGAHREPHAGGGMARPVYVDALRRGVDKRIIRALMGNSRLAAMLTCLDTNCCPGGRRDLLEDPREHAISARLRSLGELTRPAPPAWRWNYLAQTARHGVDLAQRINAYTQSSELPIPRLSVDALQATLVIADHRRQVVHRRSAA